MMEMLCQGFSSLSTLFSMNTEPLPEWILNTLSMSVRRSIEYLDKTQDVLYGHSHFNKNTENDSKTVFRCVGILLAICSQILYCVHTQTHTNRLSSHAVFSALPGRGRYISVINGVEGGAEEEGDPLRGVHEPGHSVSGTTHHCTPLSTSIAPVCLSPAQTILVSLSKHPPTPTSPTFVRCV